MSWRTGANLIIDGSIAGYKYLTAKKFRFWSIILCCSLEIGIIGAATWINPVTAFSWGAFVMLNAIGLAALAIIRMAVIADG